MAFESLNLKMKQSGISSGFLAVCVLLIGLLYIPAIMYGYFWLWVFPFVVLSALFLNSMVERAIERVQTKGDEATQAKAMIPEFLRINIIMMVMFSVPFMLSLFLIHYSIIEVISRSSIDDQLMNISLSILKRGGRLELLQDPFFHILISNLFFMIVGTVGLFVLSFKTVKRMFFILFHRETYRFLRKKNASLYIGRPLGFLTVFLFVLIIPIFQNTKYELLDAGLVLVYMSSLSIIVLSISSVSSVLISIIHRLQELHEKN